jgi:hypothetical protein
MYLPLSRSLLARRAATRSRDVQHTSGKQQVPASLQAAAANSVRAVDAGAGASAAARCTWLQLVADVQKDEELVVVYGQQHDGCDWPGLRASAS